ncbi:hypothetical protein [Symbioplanes lichenis]|uniref:hypothetical protein n=1 Tax=Symbioplanes lichenis TaxID=1629072 RepID=UPI00273977B5|nr:hypothetical protein [Actinoplanes lichenis]
MTDYLDPAQVFAYLFRHLYAHRRDFDRVDMTDWIAAEGGTGDSRRIAREIRDTGRVTVERFIEAMSDPRAAFLLLRAVDTAFGALSPLARAHDRGLLGSYQQRLLDTGAYYSDHAGSVLPKRCPAGRPQPVEDSFGDHLRWLMLVPRTADDGMCFQVLRDPLLDFDERIRRSTNAPRIVVGCVPFIADLAELEINPIDRSGARFYSISLQHGLNGRDWSGHWRTRAAAALDNLDRSGAHIGILPELALTDDLLTWWQNELLTRSRPPGSRLQWILVGTGPLSAGPAAERRPNRAVLLHRDNGRLVLEQDKCDGFSMTDEQMANWRLFGLQPGPRAEWMREGHDRVVLEAWAGRFAVLICEDFDRLFALGAPLATWGPTHLLIPVFAPRVTRYRWQQKSAQQFVNEVGAISVIANSNAIPFVDGGAGPDDHGYAMMVCPADADWSPRIEIRVQHEPTGVTTFELPGR